MQHRQDIKKKLGKQSRPDPFLKRRTLSAKLTDIVRRLGNDVVDFVCQALVVTLVIFRRIP